MTENARSFPLTASERELLRALLSGASLSEAAARLAATPDEAQQMVTRLQERAGVPSRQALLLCALAHRWAG